MQKMLERSMTVMMVLFISSVSLINPSLYGHEGHDHDAPKTLSPLKGGLEIKQFSAINKLSAKNEAVTCFVEVAKSGKKGLKIYFFNKDQKNVLAKDFQMTAWASPFKKNEKEGAAREALSLEANDKSMYYETSYENKGNAHRYHLILVFKGADYCQVEDEITFLIDAK